MTGTPLCKTLRERAFVNALLVMLYDQPSRTENGCIKATNDDIQDLMRLRWSTPADDTQLARLKRKFVSRDDQGRAQHFELLCEVTKGERTSTKRVPSVYESTGIRPFLTGPVFSL